MKISASIIVFNEESNIGELCESISFVDEIVIVDSASTDRTKEIALKFTPKIFDHEFRGYRDKHEFADSRTTGDWILWIDADERVTDELRDAIADLRSRQEADLPDGFRFARRTWYAGRWIKHSGWYPDYQMRLYRKSASFWDGVAPHETARVKGRVETLRGELLHYTKRDLSEHHRTIDSYTSLAADALSKQGKTTGAFQIFTRTVAGFLRPFLIKQGFRDGIQGLMIAMFTSYGVFLKYAKLWERTNKSE
ncbi:MAG TPA: glycosyltransferase family 2 protein [Pyrinomonadaceae bacterium]|nr:glycosyltransferase family 2 protein [Pyrinomonadaceae bacterium]